MSAMSRPPDAAPESLLPGAATTISVEAQGRIDAIGRAVARIDFADQDSGTGVLLGGRWLLTCHHVLPSRERAGQVKAVLFGYERNEEGQLQGGVPIRLDPAQGFFTSTPEPTLTLDQHDDWTLVRLADDPRLQPFGYAQLFGDAAARARTYARIVQHPGVGPKSCAEGTIGVVQNGRVSYRINTQRGSSGAPVIDIEGKIVALHQRGVDESDPFHNQGADIQRVISGIRALGGNLWKTLSQPAPPLAPAQTQRIALSRLVARHTAADFLGRDGELGMLDRAWLQQNGVVNLMSLIAWGGVGKTALLAHWVKTRFTAQGWRNADGQPAPDAYFDWTFYDQGTRSAHSDDSQHAGAASLGAFFQTAFKHFGDPDPENPQDKVGRLAALIQSQRTLLILDGLEPLQYPPNHAQAGQLTDPDLSELLGRLAQRNPGLCLVSSRQTLSELPASQTGPVREHPLEELPLEAAVDLLRQMGVRGTDDEMAQAAEDYFRHALSLTVLGHFLAVKGGDIRQRDRVKFETASETRNQRISRNAWHVLEAYEVWLASPEGNLADAQVLRLTGLFDRPASPDCLDALRRAPAISCLTDALLPLSDDAWNAVLLRLHEAHLIQLRFPADDPASWALRPEPRQVALDAHPLIREYFAKRLREQNAHGFQAAHSRLFDHLCQTTMYRPETLDGLLPLYQAVGHGCLAERPKEALNDVYINRILRGGEAYSTHKLGAIGANLGAVAAFFEAPWSSFGPTFNEADQGWLFSETAYSLFALSRLNEAQAPMRAGLHMFAKVGDFLNVARSAGNLSELELALGRLDEAVFSASQAITAADHMHDGPWAAFQRMALRTTAADALHQRGGAVDRAEARYLFEQAERRQRDLQPQLDCLYALLGFQYNDLIVAPTERAAWKALLSPDETCPFPRSSGNDPSGTSSREALQTSLDREQLDELRALDEAEHRAVKSLVWVVPRGSLLDFAIDLLSLARVALYRALLLPTLRSVTESQDLEGALDSLRKAGQAQYLPLALLTASLHHHALNRDPEAAERFLSEAQRIAERGPMPLYLADVHLHRARLFRNKAELEKARDLIRKHGYGRRREELADADAAARFW